MSYPKRFYDYNTFLKEKFGEKVHKISLDAGFTCPNRDGTVGTRGCIYCDNASFSPACREHRRDLARQIEAGMEMGKKRKAQKFIAYFQAYTNTYAPVEVLEKLYREALAYPGIVGLSIGTRPDAVDPEKIHLLESLARETFVSLEYGVQSIYNDTLQKIERGHTYEAFREAMRWSVHRGIHICAHLMLGFPWETRDQMLAMASEMNRVGVHGIKLHNLLVIRGTALAQMYEAAPFPLLSQEEYVCLVCDFLERLDSRIVCERVHANAPSEYLLAPCWNPTSGSVVDAVTAELVRRNTQQGFLT